MNQFDILGLLFGGYARFIQLDKIVFYGYWKSLTSGSLLMLHIALTLFPLYNGLGCSLFNCPLVIIIIAFSAMCVSIVALVAETILFP